MKNIVRGLSLKTLVHVYKKEIDEVVNEAVVKASKDKSVFVRRISSICAFKVRKKVANRLRL